MESSLKKENFKNHEDWKNAVRISANDEFCRSETGICPLYTFLENREYRCDCNKTRQKIGLNLCDDKVVVCPVRNIGWPEHSPGQVARYVKTYQALTKN